MDLSNVKEGMTVYSADGEKLGRIIKCDSDGFLVEKGFFFRKDYLCRYDDIKDIQGGDLLLKHRMSELQALPRDMWQPSERATSSATTAGTGATATGKAGISQETTIPVAEEELVAEKTTREAGRVKIHKEVTTETKHIDVPVTKEEVYVERVPGGGAEAAPGEATFKEADVSVPVYEEEVEIKKRPVIREEVRVSKTAYEEQRAASGQTRREDVSVEKEGKIEKLDEDSPKKKY